MFSLIICTFHRPSVLKNLLESILLQSLLPTELLVIDASHDDQTEKIISRINLPWIKYHLVEEHNRGLTRQRNVGIQLADPTSEVLVFLDDDLILESNFLEELVSPFVNPAVVGVDGLITNECSWSKCEHSNRKMFKHYCDGYFLTLPLRDKLRAILGLYPFDLQPGLIPEYGHGKSSLPPSGKAYEVEHIMGGITAYRRSLFQHIFFSTFFTGYGLYEDFDFSIRASRFGKLLSNTSARCTHHHASSGRPNWYRYGKMVVTNGWYVWRLKYPQPSLINKFKWYFITFLLIAVRFFNVAAGPERKKAFGDGIGRVVSLLILLFKKPHLQHS